MAVLCSAVWERDVMPQWPELGERPELLPALPIKSGNLDSQSKIIRWMTCEPEGAKMGMGRLPLVDLSADQPVFNRAGFPVRGELGGAVYDHMDTARLTHAKNPADLQSLLQGVLKEPNSFRRYKWPRDPFVQDVSGRKLVLVPNLTEHVQSERAAVTAGTEPAGSKYSSVGIVSSEMMDGLDLPADTKACLVAAANAALACNTHVSYQAGLKSYKRMCAARGWAPTFPMPVQHQLVWAAEMSKAKLSSGTQRVYWSGVSKITEISTGQRLARHSLTFMVAKAAENTHMKKPKIAMTWPLLAELKKSIDGQSAASMDAHCKRLLWAVSLTCMIGTFRLGEILPSKTKLGPKGKLLGGLKRANIRRMKVRIDGKAEDMFLTRILQPKERKTGAGASVDVEIFANKGPYCAVSALDNLFSGMSGEADQDWAFLFSDGTPLTKDIYNKLLKKMLKHLPGYLRVSGHSFRRAVPTMMARLGYGEEQIARQGRWRSSCWEAYTVNGRGNRWSEQVLLHKQLAELAEQEAREGRLFFGE